MCSYSFTGKGKLLGDSNYTLDQLVMLSGFGKRQIRYYITQKLVPGAGEQRGPNAVYGQETLQRLLAIAHLKQRPVGPTGRTMTLAEIRHELDQEPGVVGQGDVELDMIKPDMAPLASTAAEYLSAAFYKMSHSVSEFEDSNEEEPDNKVADMMCSISASRAPAPAMSPKMREPQADSGLGDLLQSLQTLLTELGSDTQLPTKVSPGETWRRLNQSPDIEIQVRTPDTMEARLRLNRMAIQLGRLLARED